MASVRITLTSRWCAPCARETRGSRNTKAGAAEPRVSRRVRPRTHGPRRRQFTEVNGYRLAHVEAGTRLPALLLIHGSMSDYRSWLNQMDAFGARHRTLAVSLRHCYPERWDGVGNDFNVEQHADDLAALIEELDVGAVHVVGHSRGGAVALQLALQRPELVRTLVLADPRRAGGAAARHGGGPDDGGGVARDVCAPAAGSGHRSIPKRRRAISRSA